ncbi:MAG: hypothetical protein AB3N20_07930 [Rhizobiaceae bacterium]
MANGIDRRQFTKGAVTLGAAAGLNLASPMIAAARQPYTGPNVIIVRFGGGVRRRETIEPETSYSPFLAHELTRRGTLFNNMTISSQEGVVTSHAQGTLYILTGRYDRYSDVEDRFLSERFEPKSPTLFEYLRKSFAIPDHQALIVNGEDRVSEDFLNFSENHNYGIEYRSSVLSLHWYKTWLLREKLKGDIDDEARTELAKQLAEREARNYRGELAGDQGDAMEGFWRRWRRYYGDSGFLNPRGDRLLTELSIRAIHELRPRLMMINYQDPDYVHWGNLSHYTRAISIIDNGLQQLVATVENDPEYRDNTVFVIVPDCGRDDNPLMDIACQHHFNSRSAHEIWALVFGAGIARNAIVDKPVDQISLAATIGRVMGMKTDVSEGPPLAEVFA